MVAVHSRSGGSVWRRARGNVHRSWFATLVLVVAVAAATLPPASPASASIPGWQIVSQRGAIRSGDTNTATASCPSDKVAIGGGYRIVNGGGLVDVKALSVGLIRAHEVTVTATAADPTRYPKDWYVFAIAVCADPIPGLERVWAWSPSSSTSTRGVSATCPPGKHVVGTGFTILAQSARLAALVVPDSTLDSVQASAYEARPTSDNWTIGVEAICVDGPAALGLQLVSAFSAFDNQAVKSVFARCPIGKRAIGVGGWLSSGGTGRILEALDPTWGAGVAADAREDELGFPSAWSVTSHAICAPT